MSDVINMLRAAMEKHEAEAAKLRRAIAALGGGVVTPTPTNGNVHFKRRSFSCKRGAVRAREQRMVELLVAKPRTVKTIAREVGVRPKSVYTMMKRVGVEKFEHVGSNKWRARA